jgi:hypothetical protein
VSTSFVAALPPEARQALRISADFTTYAIGRAAGLEALGENPKAEDLIGPTMGTAHALLRLLEMGRAAVGAPESPSYPEDFRRVLATLAEVMSDRQPGELLAAKRHYALGTLPPTLSETLFTLGEAAKVVPSTTEEAH